MIIKKAIETILECIESDSKREGLTDTPARVSKMYKYIFGGYFQNPESVFKVFDGGTYNQIVLLKDIEMYSMCEHHMLPFYGKAHIAYIPNKKVIGISKLARLLEIFSRRLQIQERIGEQVTTALMTHLNPLGAACIIEASHLCMRMRGVEKQNSIMITSSLRGIFLDKSNSKAHTELLQLINRS